MKIAYIINSVECGGAQLPIPDIVNLMRSRGADVTVFGLAPKDGLALPVLDAANIPVRVRSGRTKDHLCAWRWLNDELHAYRPDLIWSSLTRATLLGQLVANKLGVPAVHWQHSAKLKWANALLLKLCRKKARLWVADSPTVMRFARNTLGLKDNLACWPIFRAEPTSPKASAWSADTTIRIGSLGRLHAVKGYDVLCEAVRLLKTHPDIAPFQVVIAGDGPERNALLERIARDDLPVTLSGYCDDAMAFLPTLHLYVQPSHWEGMCVAAHEAMACGLPVIATPAGELASSIVEGETGLVVPFDNAPALAAAIAHLLKHPERLAQMGIRARKRILERFGPEAFAQAGNKVLDRVFRTAESDS